MQMQVHSRWCVTEMKIISISIFQTNGISIMYTSFRRTPFNLNEGARKKKTKDRKSFVKRHDDKN
jgi:hypothetical protein